MIHVCALFVGRCHVCLMKLMLMVVMMLMLMCVVEVDGAVDGGGRGGCW